MADDKLLRLEYIYKSFGRINVLDDINFQIDKQEIVALVGDNGAGKSTIIKIITGVHRPTSGTIYYKGKDITKNHSVKRSRRIGIETVYQERALADLQTMWRNMFAGRELTDRFGFIKIRKQRQETERMLRTHIGFTSKALTVDSEVATLSGGEKQGIAIGRALYFNADLIILDEPTMGLSLTETKRLLDFVVDIKAKGKSVIFISHNIYHVYSVSDRFIILDRGKIAGEYVKKDITHAELENKMVLLHKTGQIS